MSAYLDSLRWPEIPPRHLLVVPIGATEQHGPQLPLRTDTDIAVELCRRLADRLPDVLVAPPLPYGASGEHAGFPGTLSIGVRALELVLVELGRSADEFAGVVFVSGHGGNLEPLRAAVRLLRSEGRNVLGWMPSGPPEDSHAGYTETSAMLRLNPDLVALSVSRRGNTEPLPNILHALRAAGVRGVSADGVLGDPTDADSASGERILDGWTTSLREAIAHWRAPHHPESRPGKG